MQSELLSRHPFSVPLLARLTLSPASLLDLRLATATRELAEAEDHELGRLDRRDAGLATDLSGLYHLGRVGLLVALDIEGLRRRGSEQRAGPPDAHEEVRRGDLQLHPQPLVVGLKDAPLRPADDRLGDVVEQPADVDVPPLGVAGEGAGTPDPDSPTGERADAVDAVLVQGPLLCLGHLEPESVGATDPLVGRRLVGPPSRVR